MKNLQEKTLGADPRVASTMVFKQLVSKAKAAGTLARTMNAAALVLAKLLLSGDENVKLRAAAKIIKADVQVAELGEIEKRFAEIEARITSRNT